MYNSINMLKHKKNKKIRTTHVSSMFASRKESKIYVL